MKHFLHHAAFFLVLVFLAPCCVFAQENVPEQPAVQQPVSLSAGSGGISFEASVEGESYPVNKKLTLAMELSWTGQEEDYRLDRIEQPELENLLITGSRIESVKEAGGTASSVTFRHITIFTLQAEAEGRASVGPATAYYLLPSGERKMLATSRIEMEIGPPVHGFFEVEKNRKIVAFIAGLLLLAFVLIGIRQIVVKRQAGREEDVVQTEPPAEVLFGQALDQAGQLMAAGEFSTFSQAIVTSVRKYSQKAFKVSEKVGTTKDLLARLSAAGAEEQVLSEVGGILEHCDYTRFSGRLLTHSEATALLARARDLPRRIQTGQQ